MTIGYGSLDCPICIIIPTFSEALIGLIYFSPYYTLQKYRNMPNVYLQRQ